MLVVVAIVIIVTSMALANLPNFRDRLSLDVVAQEIAVQTRGAQVFGSATSYGGSGLIFPSYGMYFNTGQSKMFLLFSDLGDLDQNFTYDGNVPPHPGDCGDISLSECSQQYYINAPVKIVAINIFNNSEQIPVSSLSVVYPRPDTDARFCTSEIPADCIPPNTIQRAEIVIKADRSGEQRIIAIYNNGQIAVKKPVSP